MRWTVIAWAAVLACSVSYAAELPEEALEAMKSRDYEAAVRAAGAKADAEAIADLGALASLKKAIIAKAGGGRKPSVTVSFMGRRMRGKLAGADSKGYTVKIAGAEQEYAWSDATDLDFYRLAKACINQKNGRDLLTLARGCVALSLAKEAEREVAALMRVDASLRSEARKLSARIAGAAATGGGDSPAAGGDGARPKSDGKPRVAVGFESGLATGLLKDADRSKLSSLPLQDLLDKSKGRYSQIQDDGVMGHWGLDAVKARQEATGKPYGELLSGGHYQTERVIFPDLGTGITMMKLSDEPYGTGDETLYFGKAGFAADGSKMVWQRSAKLTSVWGPGSQTTSDTHGPIVRDGDGTRPRIAFRDRPNVRIPIFHPTDPGLAYAYSGREVVELDMKSEKVKRVVASGLPMWWLKLSPDGKYVASGPYGRGKIAVVQISDGKRWDIPLRRNIHDSYRFVPGNTDQVMFWYEGRGLSTEGFHTYNFKTGEDTVHKVRFDWNHGDVGRYLGFHCSGRITRFDGKKWYPYEGLIWPGKQFVDSGPYYDNPVSANGYAQHWPDDERWGYGTRIVARPYLSEITAFFVKPFAEGGRVNRFRVCYTNLRRRKDRKGAKTVVLDRPNVSYDGTKMLFNTNVFNSGEVYMAVMRKPRPPVNLKAARAGGSVKLSWEPAKYHQEIKGYLVYRSYESGRGFEPVSGKLVEGTSFTDSSAGKGARFYAVRAVEHSRTESGLSAEAAVDGGAAPVRIFAEAEDAIAADLDAPSPDAIWKNVDGRASDMYFIWQRRGDRAGKVDLVIDAPRAGSYTVFARVKSAAGAEWRIGSANVASGASPRWQWVKGGTTSLKAGKNTVAIASSKLGSCLDCVYFSTDGAFKPEGRISAVAPKPVSISASKSPSGRPRLTVSGGRDARWSHYNIYCGGAAGFVCDRATIISSPEAAVHIDWSAPGGRKFYKATQVTLDGLESKPSDAVTVE